MMKQITAGPALTGPVAGERTPESWGPLAMHLLGCYVIEDGHSYLRDHLTGLLYRRRGVSIRMAPDYAR